MNIHKVISLRISLSFAIALFCMAVPAQAGGYLHYGYGHHGGYGHSYGYGYGLHNYYGYGHHGYSHHYYGNHYSGYAYPFLSYSYRESYESDYSNSNASEYRTRNNNRGSSSATGNGWTLLGNNQASAALTDFGKQAQASPSKGGPKVGYALASADLGRLDKGVWAMRRALRTDPEALHYVVLDQHLDTKVEEIIQQYEKKLAYSTRDKDAAFMLASLHYLRRDIKAARGNLDQAMQAGQVSASTKNLRALIGKEQQ